MIQVEKQGDDEWLVTVRAARTTEHRVTVSPHDAARYGRGCPVEKLLVASFEFLLEREPNTAILSSFELAVIGRYFPEFEREIVKRLQS